MCAKKLYGFETFVFYNAIQDGVNSIQYMDYTEDP